MIFFKNKYEPIQISGGTSYITELNDKILELKIGNSKKKELQLLLLKINEENRKDELKSEYQIISEKRNGDYDFILSQLLKYQKKEQELQALISKGGTVHSTNKKVDTGNTLNKQEVINFNFLVSELKIYWESKKELNLFNTKFFRHKFDANDFKIFELQKAKSANSGDSLFSFSNKTSNYFIIIDCTGHAYSNIIIKTSLYVIINQIIEKDIDITLPELLKNIHFEFEKIFQNRNKTKLFKVGILKCNLNNVEFCGTGNNLFLVNKSEVIHYKGNKRKEHFIINRTSFNSFYLSSDGYINQVGGVEYQRFGIEQLKDLLLILENNDFNDRAEIINSKFEKWKGENKNTDDILFVGLKMDE